MYYKKAPSQRQLKVSEQIRHILSQIFIENINRLPGMEERSVTVSEVRVTSDLRTAFVYVYPLGGLKEGDNFVEILNSYAPKIRTMLNSQIRLRFSPELKFKLDDSLQNASHIEDLIESLHEQE